MFTIASLLDKQANTRTVQYWDLLENHCRLSEINTIPFPHFSWFIAGEVQHELLSETLHQVGSLMQTFSVRTSGLGVFTGETPVVYLPLIKTRQLMHYHELLWEGLAEISADINQHYAPDNWLPHITIAYGDVNPERLACAVQALCLKDLSLAIQIDNLAYLSRAEDEAKVERVIRLAD